MSVRALTVGVVKYPEPLTLIVTLTTAPARTTAVAVAPIPDALVNITDGAVA